MAARVGEPGESGANRAYGWWPAASRAATRSRDALRSTIAMMPKDGMNAANAISDIAHHPPISINRPIAREKDMPRIEPIRATRT